MAEDFLNQSPEDYLNRDDFLAGEIQAIQATEEDSRKALVLGTVAVAGALAVAFLVWRSIMKRKLREQTPENVDHAVELANKVWAKTAPGWAKMAGPAVGAAFELAVDAPQLSSAQMEWLAQEYTKSLGDYLNQTSSEALLEGFSAQVNKGIDRNVAWQRVTEAYGLDRNQMRGTITRVMKSTEEYPTELMPGNVAEGVHKLLAQRADRMGQEETFRAGETGKNIIWMYMEKNGLIREGSEKEWITAEDEDTCDICKPLDKQRASLDGKFETDIGVFWAPSCHPHCRCKLRLIQPPEEIQKAQGSDPYTRDPKGHFARRETRKPKVKLKELTDDDQMIFNMIDDAIKRSPEPHKEDEQLFFSEAAQPFFVNDQSFFAADPFFAEPEPLAPTESFFRTSEPETSTKATTMVLVFVNGKRKYVPDETDNGQQFSYHSDATGFASYDYIRNMYYDQEQGRDIEDPWAEHNYGEGKLDLDDLTKTVDSPAVIPNVYVNSHAVDTDLISTENASVMPPAMRDALAACVDEQRQYYINAETNFQKEYEGDYTWEDDILFDPTDPEYPAERMKHRRLQGGIEPDWMPKIIAFQGFFGKITPNKADPSLVYRGDTPKFSVAGKYKTRMADSNVDEEQVSVALSPSQVKDFYLSMKDKPGYELVKGIAWDDEDRPEAAMSDESVVQSFPELFYPNRWSEEGAISIVVAEPESPPMKHKKA